MERDPLESDLCHHGINQHDVWFRQHGATALTARVSMAEFRRFFQGHNIFRFGNATGLHACPTSASVITFYGATNKPRTPTWVRKWYIRQEVTSIGYNMLEKAIGNFRERLQQCVRVNGQYLKDLIIKIAK